METEVTSNTHSTQHKDHNNPRLSDTVYPNTSADVGGAEQPTRDDMRCEEKADCRNKCSLEEDCEFPLMRHESQSLLESMAEHLKFVFDPQHFGAVDWRFGVDASETGIALSPDDGTLVVAEDYECVKYTPDTQVIHREPGRIELVVTCTNEQRQVGLQQQALFTANKAETQNAAKIRTHFSMFSSVWSRTKLQGWLVTLIEAIS